MTDENQKWQILNHRQVVRLNDVLEDEIPIDGRGNFPTLYIKLSNLIRLLREKLLNEQIDVRYTCINGSAASHVLRQNYGSSRSYNDLDLIFGVKSLGQLELHKIKCCVLNCLMDLLPNEVNRSKMSSNDLKDAYVQKMVKICGREEESDRWSLISLSNTRGRNVELKFVERMKRQFEFSVDSFQIILDNLLTYNDVAGCDVPPITKHFYPTVLVKSVWGDIHKAWDHLNKKLIATWNPEEIRGGGLLKYCNLVVRGFHPAEGVNVSELERYMCSRFFIDFGCIFQQQRKIVTYLADHFVGEKQLKYDYLVTLHQVVNQSTVCLMNHERFETLNLIYEFAYQIFLEQQLLNHKLLHFSDLDHFSNYTVDQIFYGPFTTDPNMINMGLSVPSKYSSPSSNQVYPYMDRTVSGYDIFPNISAVNYLSMNSPMCS